MYSPNAFDNSATVDLSGTWVITNTSGKVSLTSEASKANRLKGMAYSLNNGVTIAEDQVAAFTFEHVIRDWYTVRMDAGYLNITADGVKISSSPPGAFALAASLRVIVTGKRKLPTTATKAAMNVEKR